MKMLILALLLISNLVYSNEDSLYLDTLILGEFDAVNGVDTVSLWTSMEEFEMFGCVECLSEIRFSNQSFTINNEGDVGGHLENVGDLDHDGIEEIAYSTDYFMGCWSSYWIYKKYGKEWKVIGYQAFYACGDEKGFKARIEILENGMLKLEGDNVDGDLIYSLIKIK